MTKLAVVTVTYRERELLRGCLQTLFADLALLDGVAGRVVVVDNASRDGTRDMVEAHFPEVVYLEMTENRGPAAAFNRGLAAALPWADYILLANNDILVPQGAISRMLSCLQERRDISGCCARLINPDGSPQYTRTHIVRFRPRNPSRSGWATFPGNGFALYRREAFLMVGGFDETFFFFNEDLDWAERARRAGLRFWYLADVAIVHYGGRGEQHALDRIHEELYRANLYWFRRHYPWLAPVIYWGQQVELAWKARWARKHRRLAVLCAIEAAKKAMVHEARHPSAPRIPSYA